MSANSISFSVSEIRADRRLLAPGALPPLTHLGGTLLRRTIFVSLRYAFYQLGVPPPPAPPVRFVGLRPYLEAPELGRLLSASPAGRAVLAAAVDPGGAGAGHRGRLRGRAAFHRLRLRVLPRHRRAAARPGSGAPPATAGPAALAQLRALLSQNVRGLGDALLAEILSSLARRRARNAGNTVPRLRGPQAAAWLRGRSARLTSLGLPDPAIPSWQAGVPDRARETGAPSSTDGLRGSFRELYRDLLDRADRPISELARLGVSNGAIAAAEDVYFVPFDLLADLAKPAAERWLRSSVETNRGEWDELSRRNSPLDSLGTFELVPKPSDLAPELFPLSPLP